MKNVRDSNKNMSRDEIHWDNVSYVVGVARHVTEHAKPNQETCPLNQTHRVSPPRERLIGGGPDNGRTQNNQGNIWFVLLDYQVLDHTLWVTVGVGEGPKNQFWLGHHVSRCHSCYLLVFCRPVYWSVIHPFLHKSWTVALRKAWANVHETAHFMTFLS